MIFLFYCSFSLELLEGKTCTFYSIKVLQRWKKSMQFVSPLTFEKVIHQFFQKSNFFTLCNKFFHQLHKSRAKCMHHVWYLTKMSPYKGHEWPTLWADHLNAHGRGWTLHLEFASYWKLMWELYIFLTIYFNKILILFLWKIEKIV